MILIWAFPTRSANLPHAFTGIREASLCRRYSLQSLELAEMVEIHPDTVACAACKRKAAVLIAPEVITPIDWTDITTNYNT